MKLPLPVQDGWSQVASCRTRGELVQLLASLLIETGAPESVTADDYAAFRAACADVLPAAHVEWIATVTLFEAKREAERQLREDGEQELAAIRDERL